MFFDKGIKIIISIFYRKLKFQEANIEILFLLYSKFVNIYILIFNQKSKPIEYIIQNSFKRINFVLLK
jgi:hypothetical protein